MKRLVIIGAGPVGIEAAVRGLERGWDVTVLEKDRVGAHLLRWGHVRFFTPVRDNASDLLLKYVSNKPDPGAYLRGDDFVRRVLAPAIAGAGLKNQILEGWQAASICRRRLLKTDLPHHPLRYDRPFQILMRRASGEERVIEADAVLDATGVYSSPNAAGESGMPCLGERRADGLFTRHLPDLAGKLKAEWLGRAILVVGNGHSAATAISWLGDLAMENPKTEVHWIVKGDNARPCAEVANDPLPERRNIVRAANDLAENPPENWKIHRKSHLISVERDDDGAWLALVGHGADELTVRVAKGLSLTGYRPDASIFEELQVSLSPVTGGAAGLAKSLMNITDCLAPVRVAPEALDSGEKNFYLVGHKSYGRLNTFLLRSGLEQLEQIFKKLD
jgi:hypothetical protein